MKLCKKCGVVRTQDQFYSAPRAHDKLHSWCKTCCIATATIRRKERVAGLRAQRNPVDEVHKLLSRRWAGIINRQDKCYRGIEVRITRERFFELMRDDDFTTLYSAYKDAGCPLYLMPTVDRIDPNGHYEEGNIRWVTFSENARRARHTNTHKTKAIQQFDRTGRLVASHSSMKKALEAIGHPSGMVSNLSSCCRGRIPSAYGFVWKYVDNPAIPSSAGATMDSTSSNRGV